MPAISYCNVDEPELADLVATIRARRSTGKLLNLDRMCDWMRDDMPAALVEHMAIADVRPPFPSFDGFEQRPTA